MPKYDILVTDLRSGIDHINAVVDADSVEKALNIVRINYERMYGKHVAKHMLPVRCREIVEAT